MKDIFPQPRSILVESQTGRTFKRNRRHMYPTREHPPLVMVPDDDRDIYEEPTITAHRNASHNRAVEPRSPIVPPKSPVQIRQNQAKPGKSPQAPATAKYEQVSVRPELTTRSGRVSKGKVIMDM